MADDPAVGEFERRELFRPGCLEELIAGASTQKRQRTAVCGDDFLIVDSCTSQRFLNAPARVELWPAVIPVANEKGRLLLHPVPPKYWVPQFVSLSARKPFAMREPPLR